MCLFAPLLIRASIPSAVNEAEAKGEATEGGWGGVGGKVDGGGGGVGREEGKVGYESMKVQFSRLTGWVVGGT